MTTAKRFLTVCLLPLLADLYPLHAAQPGDRLWEFRVGGKGFHWQSVDSSPAIGADGAVYVGARYDRCWYGPGGTCVVGGSVYALDGLTGQRLWETETSAAVPSSPAIGADGTLYVASLSYYDIRGLVSQFLALDGATGQSLWWFPFDYIYHEYVHSSFASAAIGEDGTVYVGGQGKPYALHGQTGRLLWESAAGGVGGSSPAIGADGTVYVGSYDARVYALNGTTGRKRWEFRTGDYVYSSPAIGADGTVYVGSTDGKLYALNGATGRKRWEFSSGGPVYSSPAIGAYGTVYVGSDDCKLYALDGATGRRLWESPTGGPVRSSPAVGADGTVYVGSHDHKVYALDGTTGQKLWDFTTGSLVQSSPAIGADGTVYVGSEDGKVYALCSSSVGGLARSPWPKFRHDAQNTGRYTAPPTVAAKHSGLVVLKQGQDGRITLQVSGGPLPHVQWLFNGVAVASATNATLIVPVVTRALEGTYRLIASNALGQATSAPIVAVVSNVDPQRFVSLRWPSHADTGLSLEFTESLGVGAAWHTLSNYPPAAAEQKYLGQAPTTQGFYRLAGTASPPSLTLAGWVDGWQYTASAGTKHRIQYTTASAGWRNWLTLTNLVLPTSPYLFLDDTSPGAPARVYRTTPVP